MITKPPSASACRCIRIRPARSLTITARAALCVTLPGSVRWTVFSRPFVNRSKNNASLIELKSQAELDKLRRAGRAAAEVLKKLSESITPGISTKALDDIAFAEIKARGMKPAFLGY